jgi:hypothetical protein
LLQHRGHWRDITPILDSGREGLERGQTLEWIRSWIFDRRNMNEAHAVLQPVGRMGDTLHGAAVGNGVSSGVVDDVPVIVYWRREGESWRPHAAIRLWWQNGAVVGIRDYIHVDYRLTEWARISVPSMRE